MICNHEDSYICGSIDGCVIIDSDIILYCDNCKLCRIVHLHQPSEFIYPLTDFTNTYFYKLYPKI